MRKYLEYVQSFFGNVYSVLRAFIAIPLFSSFKSRLEPCQNDDVITVVGNGPSAKIVIDKCLQSGYKRCNNIMVVNFFGTSDDFLAIKPLHYLIIDSSFYEGRLDDNIRAQYDLLISNLQKVDWDMSFYVPNHRKNSKFVGLIGQNRHIKILPINTTPVEGPARFRNYIYGKQLGMALCANVINAALFIAVNLGYKHIDVYGIEHSWLTLLFHDDKGYLCTRQSHFYKDDMIIRLPKGSLGGSLIQIANCLHSYQLCEDYSKYKGAHIVNRTPKSFVDVFDIED